MEIDKEKIKQSLSRFKEYCNTCAISRKTIKIDINDAIEIVNEIGRGFTSDFVIDDTNRFVYENLIKWVNGDESMYSISPDSKEIIKGRINSGLFIAGPTGTGKTMCIDVIKVYAKVIGARIHFKPEEESRKLSWNNVLAHNIAKAYQNTGDVSEYEKQRILCIQDFGCENEKSMYMGNAKNVLRELIENRSEEYGKILLATSNLPLMHEQTRAIYGDRVISRLCHMCNYFELKGNDRRLK